MNLRQFRAFAVRLQFIDRDQLPSMTDGRWELFRDDPAKFVLGRLITSRQSAEIEAALASFDALIASARTEYPEAKEVRP